MKFLLGLFLSILSINISSAKECHISDSVKLCFLQYKVKYKEICYKNEVIIKTVKHKENTNNDITTLKYNIKNSKIIGGKNWFNFCFYPVNYYQGVCRKKICGDFNIPKIK